MTIGRLAALALVLQIFGGGHIGFAQPADEDLRVLADWMRFSDAENALYHHFRRQADDLLEARAAEILTIDSREGWLARQEEVAAALRRAIGPLPARTPLNVRITDTVVKPGIRVEKLVYESVPGFHVTAALFLPDEMEAPAPAILFASGHSVDGFRAPAYQTMILNLVHKGFIVLAFDPVGQGERLEYVDETTDEPLFGPTRQHSYPGAQQLIVGHSPARLMIWDAIRGIDYLVSRDEVDPERIGVTGRSGGGTQSSFVAALDERVLAAAPEAYLTSYGRLFASRGPQDAEQNFVHGIALGLDHPDLLEVRAPKPTLVIATTRDIFSIQGTRETVAEARRAFDVLGDASALEMVEDDEGHASTRRNRESMVRFFQASLGRPGEAHEDEAIQALSAAELTVTPTGQVATSFAGETVFSINRKHARGLGDALETSRSRGAAHLSEARRAAARLSGFVAPEPDSGAVFTGRYRRDAYSIEKYFLPGEGDYVVPLLLAVPEGDGPFEAVIYLLPDGKTVDASVESLVRQGFVVAVPDVLGVGETGPGRFRGDAFFDGTSYNAFFAAMLVGRSIVAVRAGDALRVTSFLRERPDVRSDRVLGVARGSMGPVLLHAAALGPADSFAAIATLGALVSYESIVMEREYQPELVHTSVAGALTAYDLPDLGASLAPVPLFMGNALDATGAPMNADALAGALTVVREAYGRASAAQRFVVHASDAIGPVAAFFARP